jgi:uncharacterized membrane protein
MMPGVEKQARSGGMMSGVCAACGATIYDEHAACTQCGQEGAVAVSADLPGPREQGRIPENLAATLAYVTVVPAIVFLLTKPYSKNQFVRFHAFQCVGMAVAGTVIATVFVLLANVPAVNLLLIPVSLIGVIGIALLAGVCMIKAYQHQMYALPVLGRWAQKQSLRP